MALIVVALLLFGGVWGGFWLGRQSKSVESEYEYMRLEKVRQAVANERKALAIDQKILSEAEKAIDLLTHFGTQR